MGRFPTTEIPGAPLRLPGMARSQGNLLSCMRAGGGNVKERGESMLEIKKVGDDRIEFKMSGRLDAEHMRVALDEISEKVEGIENGVMLYEIVDFKLPTPSAIAIEFGRLPSMIGLMRRFRKAAVLTDKTWLKKTSEFEGALIPGLEIKAFPLDEREATEAWLSA